MVRVAQLPMLISTWPKNSGYAMPGCMPRKHGRWPAVATIDTAHSLQPDQTPPVDRLLPCHGQWVCLCNWVLCIGLKAMHAGAAKGGRLGLPSALQSMCAHGFQWLMCGMHPAYPAAHAPECVGAEHSGRCTAHPPPIGTSGAAWDAGNSSPIKKPVAGVFGWLIHSDYLIVLVYFV